MRDLFGQNEEEFRTIFTTKDCPDLIPLSIALLKQHMTAQTAWKVMESLFSTTQLHFIRLPDEDDRVTHTSSFSSSEDASDTSSSDTLNSFQRMSLLSEDDSIDSTSFSLTSSDS